MFWALLELSETTNEKDIKRAYAKKLKTCHPEDDALAYQSLREAYESALKFARKESIDFMTVGKHTLEEEVDPQRRILQDATNNRSPFKEDDYELEKKKLDERTSSETDQVVQQIILLYEDLKERECVKNWEQILSAEIMWSLEVKEEIFLRVTSVAVTMTYLPFEVWQVLDKYLRWTEREGDLLKLFGREVQEMISNRIKFGKPFVGIAKDMPEIKIEGYYRTLYSIEEKLKTRDWRDLDLFLDQALVDYPDDPNLHLLYAEYALYVDKYLERSKHLDRLKLLCPDNIAMRLYIARLFEAADRLILAMHEYEELLMFFPECIDAKIGRIKTHLLLDNTNNCYQYLLELIVEYPNNKDVMTLSRKVLNVFTAQYNKSPLRLVLRKKIIHLNRVLGMGAFNENLKLRTTIKLILFKKENIISLIIIITCIFNFDNLLVFGLLAVFYIIWFTYRNRSRLFHR